MQNHKKLFDTKISDIDEKTIIKGFIETAKLGLCTKEDLTEKHQFVEEKIEVLNSELADLQVVIQRWENGGESNLDILEQKESHDKAKIQYKATLSERDQWAAFLVDIETELTEYKNFNKALCFSNIRELLKQNADVKIGQIEKEAGIRLGYMSRLEKEGNTSEPSMEFIVSAAKLLKVSIDTLVSVDLTGLTPTEQYLVNFFDKLKADTLKDKLDWNRETAFDLNNMETDENGYVDHPLFDEETFYEESECDYPNEVTRVVFTSKSFGPKTYITDDCFNLRLKNGTRLYLMDISKSVHKTNDLSAFAKEAWMFVPGRGSQFLVSTKDETPLAPLLEVLFATVRERMEHPKVNSDVMYAINAFMNDDLEDDENNTLPF